MTAVTFCRRWSGLCRFLLFVLGVSVWISAVALCHVLQVSSRLTENEAGFLSALWCPGMLHAMALFCYDRDKTFTGICLCLALFVQTLLHFWLAAFLKRPDGTVFNIFAGTDSFVILSWLFLQFAEVLPVVSANRGTCCLICATNEVGIIFFPCGHASVCVECEKTMASSNCPTCYTNITQVNRVFYSGFPSK